MDQVPGSVRKRASSGVRRRRSSRPFWLPAPGYYVLSVAIAGIVFFLIWGILLEGGEEAPWVTAGIAASLLLIVAVLIREIVLRGARRRFLEAERRLDRNLKGLPRRPGSRSSRKLSIEDNRRMLAHIGMKSNAARVLQEVGEGHHEVFLLCDDYLRITYEELRRTDVNSPRYLAMRKGRSKVKRLHRYHLLAWSEVESRSLSKEARDEPSLTAKIRKATRALEIVEEAARHYPSEEKLLDSASALRDFITSVSVTTKLEEAEKLESDGERLKALEAYEEILLELRNEELEEERREILRERIEMRISGLRSSHR